MNRFLTAGGIPAREFLFAKYGKGGIVDTIKNAIKIADTTPDPARRKAIGLRDKVVQEGALKTVENGISSSELDTLQKALGNVGQAILNEPVSRREVLKRGALSTASSFVPGGGVLQQIAKEVAPTILKAEAVPKTEAEIAETIAKYATNFIQNERAVKVAYDFAVGKSGLADELVEEFVANTGEFPTWYVLQEITQSDPKSIANAAKEVGLDIASVANATGLSPEDVKRVMNGDADLLQSIVENSAQRVHLEQILEDGRPKEAYRSTSISDIEGELDNIIDSVVNEYGKDFDGMDIAGEVSDRVRKRFFENERMRKNDNMLFGTMSEYIIDDPILERVFGQGVYDEDYLDIYGRVFEKLEGR